MIWGTVITLPSVPPRVKLNWREGSPRVDRKLIEDSSQPWSFLSHRGLEGESGGEAESGKDALGPWTAAPASHPPHLLVLGEDPPGTADVAELGRTSPFPFALAAQIESLAGSCLFTNCSPPPSQHTRHARRDACLLYRIKLKLHLLQEAFSEMLIKETSAILSTLASL